MHLPFPPWVEMMTAAVTKPGQMGRGLELPQALEATGEPVAQQMQAWVR
ncbi:MAG: hypothetical protein ACKVY0_14515 [Prosthecobacter sp.]